MELHNPNLSTIVPLPFWQQTIKHALVSELRNSLVCLNYFTFKSLSLKVCNSNLIVEIFILLKFRKKIINKISKVPQNDE